MFLNAISTHVTDVDNAMIYIMGFSTLMLLGITAVMLFYVYKYHEKRHPKPKQTHGSNVMEVIWIVVPTIIVSSMFFVGNIDFDELRSDTFDHEVKVMAKMWEWDIHYTNGHESDTVFFEVNKTTRFNIGSYDVIHSFYIPALRLKEDAVPGKVSTYNITPLETGEFDIACAEYCGKHHSRMYTKLVVLSADDYKKWYDSGKKDQAEK